GVQQGSVQIIERRGEDEHTDRDPTKRETGRHRRQGLSSCKAPKIRDAVCCAPPRALLPCRMGLAQHPIRHRAASPILKAYASDISRRAGAPLAARWFYSTMARLAAWMCGA